jgi:peroxiredoxin
MKLTTNTPAPAFTGELLGGGHLSLADLRGRTVLLKFYRFVECPICNLHLRELARRHDEVAATGLETVVLFHSPLSRAERKQGFDLPFQAIADPEKRIFRSYGVEESLGGMFARKVARDYARAMGAGLYSKPFGYHGGIKGHPADFIIDGHGVIRHAHYGESYADSLGVDDVVSLASELRIAPRSAPPGPSEVHDRAAAAAHQRS